MGPGHGRPERCRLTPPTFLAAPVLPVDFPWHQSSLALMLRCPKAFELRYVHQLEPDHNADNYAAPLGTGDHCGCDLILQAANAGRVPDRQEVLDQVLVGFQAAVAKATDRGATFDPEGLDRALERAEGERLDRLMALANDPRVHAIHWEGIEWQWKVTERGGRVWQGTIDAWGVAKRDVDDFGALGRDPIHLAAGERVCVDWKTGALPPFDYVARRRHVQLGVYAMALAQEHRRRFGAGGEWRLFLGLIQDLDRPKAPTDEDGKRIPKSLPKQINPQFAEAAGMTPDEAAAFKGRPKGIPKGVPKWLPEQPNPAYERAISQPKGPLFREARVDFDLVLETARTAIRQAELGLFPATGAATGQCGRCSFRTLCTNNPNNDDHDQEK